MTHNLKQTPFLKIKTMKVDIQKTVNADGNIILESSVALKTRPHRFTQRLIHWAKKTPNKIFIAQKDAQGQWQSLTYSQTLQKVETIAQHLLQTNLSPERPLAILSENSIEHGLIALAALHIGLPYSPIAPAYSLKSTDFDKLKHTINLLTPGLIFVQDGKQYGKALEAVAGDIDIVAVNNPLSHHTHFSKWLNPPQGFDGLMDIIGLMVVRNRFKTIEPDTIAKILFTSGSTGLPKGVINTHGNITTNWQQITQIFPFMQNGGLTFIDWLPWNHVFGGNHNFGLTLFNGGSLYIDEGNPTPRGIHKTIENLRYIAPTMYCNVPKGFEELIPHLKADKALCEHFFSQLKLLFYAGAGMPQHVWDALEQLAYETTGKRVLISTGLGMTEASPSCMFNTHFGSFPSMLGTPVAGMSLKLVPNGDKMEVRFRAPNVTSGYWRNPEATAKAFDTEGYYCTGDALKFVDENDPNQGMIFDGRIAEDFKLDTGTWVSVGVLKAKFITAGKGLIQDVAITGHDRSFLGAIVFPELNFCKKLARLSDSADLTTVINDPSVKSALQGVLNAFAKHSTGSSTLIKRAVFADFTLSIDKGEITDKGSINQRAILKNHADYVERIYEKTLQPTVLEVQKDVFA
ncbi:MAG: feruloyl-CoA synthase [Saprospiraceae bacterium]|nr:feruloyl-CoA synthase [Saprospiraceae bacterium]